MEVQTGLPGIEVSMVPEWGGIGVGMHLSFSFVGLGDKLVNP